MSLDGGLEWMELYLIPAAAHRSKEFCNGLPKVKDLRPLKMVGWYATMQPTPDSAASASSATAAVRSMVSSTLAADGRANAGSRISPVLSCSQIDAKVSVDLNRKRTAIAHPRLRQCRRSQPPEGPLYGLGQRHQVLVCTRKCGNDNTM